MKKSITNYIILLITETEVKELAIVSSKGLAYKTMQLYQDIYYGDKIEIKETKKRLKTVEKMTYYYSES